MYQTVQMTRMAKLPELFTFFKTRSSKCQRPFDFFAPRPQSVVCNCKIQDEQVCGDVQNTIPNLQCFRPLRGMKSQPEWLPGTLAVLLSETNMASGRTWNAPVWDYFISMRLYSSKGKKNKSHLIKATSQYGIVLFGSAVQTCCWSLPLKDETLTTKTLPGESSD